MPGLSDFVWVFMTSSSHDNAAGPEPVDAAVAPDALAHCVSAVQQKQAAHSVQDGFAQVFRLTLQEDDAGRQKGVAAVSARLAEWVDAGEDTEARALRQALIIFGLDQWGVAYSRAFQLGAIAGLTELVGALRTRLDAQAEARFQRFFEQINAAEGSVIDFKIELRRGIHLALWHAMIAAEERTEAEAILAQLGGLMLALVREMPQLGWRLVADALAHVQIRCLAQNLATEGLAQEMTESLFASLSRELPASVRNLVLAHSTQAVLAWQQAERAGSDRVH